MDFRDRQDAGKQLAKKLAKYKDTKTVVLALPRGGVVLGAEVAKALNLPLGVVLVRKIGHPGFAEYAIGAVADNGDAVYNAHETAGVREDWLQHAVEEARTLNDSRRALYYKDVMPPEITHKTVLLVDDGIATGLTMLAAIQSVLAHRPEQIVVAVPVAPEDCLEALKKAADDVVVLADPKSFYGAVGAHYKEFPQVSDEEVVRLLREVQHDIQHSATSNP